MDVGSVAQVPQDLTGPSGQLGALAVVDHLLIVGVRLSDELDQQYRCRADGSGQRGERLPQVVFRGQQHDHVPAAFP